VAAAKPTERAIAARPEPFRHEKANPCSSAKKALLAEKKLPFMREKAPCYARKTPC
jgi:hypothetical protein